MGVDQAAADLAGGGQAELLGGLGQQETQRRADRACNPRQYCPLKQVLEPDRGQEIGLPARRLVGKVGPLAGHGAAGAGVRAGRTPGQEIGKVQDPPIAPPLLRQMALEPHELGDLHLGRHCAADEVEHPVTGRGAFLRLRNRAMIEPDQRVPARLAADRDRGGPIVAIERHQGAGRIEADPRDRLGRDAGLVARRARGGADRAPDIVAVLLGVAGDRPVERDRPAVPGEHPAVAIEQAGACAAGADVDRHDDAIVHVLSQRSGAALRTLA